MGNLLVKDDAGVEYTFVPVTDTPRPLWRANVAAVPFEGQMTYEFSESKTPDGGYKRQGILSVPVMEQLGTAGSAAGYVAAAKVAYTEKVYVTQVSSRRSTLADRANSMKLAIGISQGASVTTATGVLSNTSANDAWKNSALPLVAAYTQGVIPN